MKKIDKIVVANRGEIALRVMRSAREMGIATVAVYSDADRTAPFVRFADEAIHIGPSPSGQSYLRGEKIIEAARLTGAQAIHPGYGFLSENAEFAEMVERSGLIFIGPPPHAIRTMGDKLSAKEAVKRFDIPMVPGTPGAIDDLQEAIAVSKQIGLPVLIKASAGGGGKGMRVVHEESELAEQMQRASSEALSSFGNGAVFIEKYVSGPRHIEFQVLADEHGHVVHLFERECSIQRRHQKVVEEAPSSVLTPELRAKMGEAAVLSAKSCGYVGAGTVEFLLDDQLNFYFLEMNTRLQVEHPVTELITGLDLVKEQIRIARGEALGYSQEDIRMHGHAIELRVNAENPFQGFLPETGTLSWYKPPKGPGVRVDDGYEQGMDIPLFYDPMIAKLIVYGNDREEAMARMMRAIEEFEILGIETTLPFGQFVMHHAAFRSGHFDTHFVNQYFTPEVLLQGAPAEVAALAAGLVAHQGLATNSAAPETTESGVSLWKWRRQR
jgi:acetyl-CoA carboxylase biotin carboxylase subunit